MLPAVKKSERRPLTGLGACIYYSIEAINDISNNMYSNHSEWQRRMLGHNFTVSRTCREHGEGGNVLETCKTWLATHEEAQVMMASVLIIVGVWWMVRTVLTLIINLVCPLLVVLLAVVCIPQLRAPLLGQNYPMVASLLKSILLKLAENIKTQ